MKELLDFLSCSFEGGTDINEPIKRSLDLLCNDADKEWSRADILIVTDSEIPSADAELREKLEYVGLSTLPLQPSSPPPFFPLNRGE